MLKKWFNDYVKTFKAACVIALVIMVGYLSFETTIKATDNATTENVKYTRGMKLLREIKAQSLTELKDGSIVMIKNPRGKDLQDLNEVGISKSPFGQHYYEKALLMAPKVERVFFPGNEDHRNASTRYLNQ